MSPSWIVVIITGHSDCEGPSFHSVCPPGGRAWHDVSLHDLFALCVETHDRSCRRTLAGTSCLGTWFDPNVTSTTRGSGGSRHFAFNLTPDAQCPKIDAMVSDFLGSDLKWFHGCGSATPEGIPISFAFKVGSHAAKRKHEDQGSTQKSQKMRLDDRVLHVEGIDKLFIVDPPATGHTSVDLPVLCRTLDQFKVTGHGRVLLNTSRFITKLEEWSHFRGRWAFNLHIPSTIFAQSATLDMLLKYWGLPRVEEDANFRQRVFNLLQVAATEQNVHSPNSLLILHIDGVKLQFSKCLNKAIAKFVDGYGHLGFETDPSDLDDLLVQVQKSGFEMMICVSGYDSAYLHLFAQGILSGNADPSTAEALETHVTEFGEFHSTVLKWYKANVIQKVLYVGETPSLRTALARQYIPWELCDISGEPLVLESFTMTEETANALLKHFASLLFTHSRAQQHISYHLAELKKSAAFHHRSSKTSYIVRQVHVYLQTLGRAAKRNRDRESVAPFAVTHPIVIWDAHKIDLVRYVGEYSDFSTKKLFADLLTLPDTKGDLSVYHLWDTYKLNPHPVAREGAGIVRYQLHRVNQVFWLMVAFGMLIFTPSIGSVGTISMPNPVVRNTLYRQLRVITEQAARPKLLETDNVGFWMTTMLDQWLRSRPPPALRGQNSNCIISEMTIQEHLERLINDAECFHAAEHRALMEVRVVRDLRVRQAKQDRSTIKLKELKELCDREGDEYAAACKFGWLDAAGDMVAEGAIDLVVLPYPFFLVERLPKQARAVQLIELKYISLKNLFQGVFGHQIHLLTDESLEQFADALTRLLDSGDVKEILRDLPTTLHVPKLMDDVQKEKKNTRGRESPEDVAPRKFPGKGVKITLHPSDLVKAWYQDGTYYRQSLREIMIDATRQVVQYGHCIAQGKNPNASKNKLSYLEDSRIKALFKADETQRIAMHVVVVVGTRAVFHSLPSELSTSFHFHR